MYFPANIELWRGYLLVEDLQFLAGDTSGQDEGEQVALQSVEVRGEKEKNVYGRNKRNKYIIEVEMSKQKWNIYRLLYPSRLPCSRDH